MCASFTSNGFNSRQKASVIMPAIRSAIDSIRERLSRRKQLGDPLIDSPPKRKHDSVKFTMRGDHP